jgi:transcriptional regulator with XRE-family HTH domain
MSDTLSTWRPRLVNDFALRLRATRLHLGLNQQEFAAHCGLRNTEISRWEAGSMPRRLHLVVKAISDATGVDRDWLMWGEPGPDGDGDVTTGLLRPLLRIITFDDAAFAA